MLQQVSGNYAGNGANASVFQAPTVPPGLPAGKWVMVTAEQAAAWLRTGTPRNRRLSRDTVRLIKSDMVAGKWVPTYDPIMLRVEDRSVGNGQHRLTAQAEMGLTLWWFVIENATQEMIDAVDCGRVRKVSDRLSIEGVAQAITIASRMAVVNRLEKGVTSLTYLSRKASKHEIMDAAVRYAEPLAWSIRAITGNRGLASASYAGAMIFAYKTDPIAADSFSTQVKSGEMIQRGQPAYTLRQYLLGRTITSGSTMGQYATVATLRAFQAEMRGEQIRQLKPAIFTKDTIEALIGEFAAANK